MTSSRLLLLAVAAALLAGCAGSRPGPAVGPGLETTGSARRLPAETNLSFASGSRFLAAPGWWVTEGAALKTLEDPDRELRVVLLEIPGRDPVEAIAAGWRRVRPDFARKIEQTLRPPARDGWDSMALLTYQTATAEERTVMGSARIKGQMAYVALVDGKTAAVARRSAQVNTAVLSWKAPGAQEESFRGKKAHALEGERLRRFEAFLVEARRKARVPGAAVAVVQGGRVVYEKGFGVREAGKPDSVTPSTLFMIGSTTKALTTLLQALLVDEGKLTWETPLVGVLPEFALADPETTRQVQVRHTACACTGMPRQDMEFLFEYAGVTAEQRLASMRTMKPTTGFGETFQYSNLMVAAGGYAAGRVFNPQAALSPAYDAAIRAKVFGPLGMVATTFDMAAAEWADHATPHGTTLALEVRPLPLGVEGAVVAVAPAGGAWSTVRDLCRYVLLELGNGTTPEDTQLLSEANLLRRRVPQVRITDKMSYGLGLIVEDDHGLQVIHHGGNTLGFSSDLFFLPEHGLGMVVLTNAGGAGRFTSSVRRRLFEVLFDGRDEAANLLDFSLKALEDWLDKTRKKVQMDPDPSWIQSFARTFRSSSLGEVTVRLEGSTWVLDAGEWKVPVGRKREDDGSQMLILLGPALMGLELIAEEKNGKPRLVLDAAQQKYVFEPSSAP